MSDDSGGSASAAAPAEFLNREASWLEFNRRVLHEALDDRTPLLERVGFLAIFNSNLDEYYQKRIGGLKRQIRAQVQTRSADGLSPGRQIQLIRDMVVPMLRAQAECYETKIKPALATAGIHLLSWAELSAAERVKAAEYFEANLFPVLTPLSVDPGHPFPFISNLSTSLGVMLRHPDDAPVEEAADAEGAAGDVLGAISGSTSEAGRAGETSGGGGGCSLRG